ncbi:MAG: ATP-dependent DNA helicase RecG, partial [Alloprevotella sp.]|nr:ATP-dependent DNA helicase RecG [Alloprevotella sp.]
MFNRFYHERLPFELTGAQKRVVREIRRDTGSGAQMNRLLQGDVGSGKTMVALMACLLAVDNGYQACLMAPTEILAEQHLATLREQLGHLPVRVELLTGIVKGRARREVLEGLANGTVQILVGTHALIEPTVRFANLGLAVIDEQHRFGVTQRAALWNKNARPPHILVMTATPIPRTLAMTVYGDLDVSLIDELPPGRKPIRTIHYYENQTVKLFEGIRYQLSLGRQIYVIYPLIKESEKLSVQFVEQGYADVQKALPQYRVGMVHGQMRPQDKEVAMQAFKRGETHVLVSTTVIEVGVNVPNASVMVIQNAERFGLAQLHQLRGRVGRGSEQSYCVLVTKRELSEDTRRRMQIMVETTDGFEIAEEDMKLRGPGDLEGTQQSGMPFDLKVANVVRDADLMAEARRAAAAVLQADPQQALPQNAPLWHRLDQLKADRKNFSAIS